jgi:insulin-like growth factor 1 receptor
MHCIRTGKLMEKPENCDDVIYDLMLKCWKFNAEERLSFKEIVAYILDKFEVPKKFKRVSHYHNSIKKSN